jgi:hypothetical protein
LLSWVDNDTAFRAHCKYVGQIPRRPLLVRSGGTIELVSSSANSDSATGSYYWPGHHDVAFLVDAHNRRGGSLIRALFVCCSPRADIGIELPDLSVERSGYPPGPEYLNPSETSVMSFSVPLHAELIVLPGFFRSTFSRFE